MTHFCSVRFERTIIRFESDNDRNSTIIETKSHGSDEWKHCLEYPKAIDFTVHTFVTSGGKSKDFKNKRRGIYIHSIKFYDNEEEIEGEQEQIAGDHQAFRDYMGTATDLLHMGNTDGVLLTDET